MSILAIDPGRDQGWALLREDKTLIDCGLGEAPLDFVGHRVVVERPQIYRGRASKADPNDLITLAILVGRLTERYSARGCHVEHILPHDWKGSVDGDVLVRRIEASLDTVELEVLHRKLASVPKGKRHNVIDAIGLGKWSLVRARAGVF